MSDIGDNDLSISIEELVVLEVSTNKNLRSRADGVP